MNLLRLIISLILCVAGTFGSAQCANALTVAPDDAPAGTLVDLTFTVKSNLPGVATNKVEIDFPADHRVSQLLPQNVDGWSSSVQETTTELPSVTWSGGSIAQGQSTSFVVSAKLPVDTDSLKLSAIQTYSDGQVQKWTEGGPSATGLPAPVLHISGASTTTSPAAVTSTTAVAPTSPKKHSTNIGTYFIGFGVGLGVLVYLRDKAKKRNKT